MKHHSFFVFIFSLISFSLLPSCDFIPENEMIKQGGDLVNQSDESHGMLHFEEGAILIKLDLNDPDLVILSDDPEKTRVHVGPVLTTLLSPNKQFLAIETGQGGGVGIMIYSLESKVVHVLGSFHAELEWLENGRLRVENYVAFGEQRGDLEGVYESIDSQAPWNIRRLEVF